MAIVTARVLTQHYGDLLQAVLMTPHGSDVLFSLLADVSLTVRVQ